MASRLEQQFLPQGDGQQACVVRASPLSGLCRQKERAYSWHERPRAGRKSGPTAGMSGVLAMLAKAVSFGMSSRRTAGPFSRFARNGPRLDV